MIAWISPDWTRLIASPYRAPSWTSPETERSSRISTSLMAVDLGDALDRARLRRVGVQLAFRAAPAVVAEPIDAERYWALQYWVLITGAPCFVDHATSSSYVTRPEQVRAYKTKTRNDDLHGAICPVSCPLARSQLV